MYNATINVPVCKMSPAFESCTLPAFCPEPVRRSCVWESWQLFHSQFVGNPSFVHKVEEPANGENMLLEAGNYSSYQEQKLLQNNLNLENYCES